MGLLSKFFTGGVVSTVERLASEFIETDMESAEAKALMIKTLDPNGKMRRDLSKFACHAYGGYLVVMSLLALMLSFGLGDVQGAKDAASMFSELFFPITGAWTAIVSASFGVNAANTIKGRP